MIKKRLNFTVLRKKLSKLLLDIPEFRQKAKVAISIDDAMMSGFACMYFQDLSLLQFQKRMQEEEHSSNLQTLFEVENIPKQTQKGSKTYSHQVLQGGIMHPDCSEIIPFMPEQIVNGDGASKQDCEMNAAKRFIEKLRKDFPQLGLLIGGDALFSKQPIIEDVLKGGMHYLFVANPTDHKYMMEWLDAYNELHQINFRDDKGREHFYEWMNDVPLNGQKKSVRVNFLRCTISGKNKKGKDKILYRNSWVTDWVIWEENIKTLVRAGRCRWKNENECFNVMKNHGYCMEHNYGHGQKNLAFNFYLLTLLAFSFHQIFELTDCQYKACRKKFGSKRHLWEKLRSWIDIIIFETWEKLLEFTLTPKKGLLTWAQPP
jgi:hypothetical protein